MKTRTIVFAIITMTWVGGVSHAGDLTVIGNLGVASNLTANALAVNTVSLGGIARTNWPSGGTTTASVTDLSTAVLDFSQPGRFYRYTLTADTAWTFTNHVAGKQVWLQIAQDSTGGRNTTWPADLIWPNGTQVNGASTPNTFSVFKILDNGSNWLAQADGLNYSVPCGTNCNHALQFDGSQNYVDVPASDSFGDLSAFTLQFWIHGPYPSPCACNYAFIGNEKLGIVDNNGSYFYPYAYLTGGVVYGDWGAIPSDTNYHHYAFCYDGSTVWGYLDGVNVGSAGASGTLPIASQDFTIGTILAWGAFEPATFAQVEFASVCRYPSGTSFTPSGCLGSDADTIAYWQFNEGSGTTAADSSGNGHDGALVGSPQPIWVNGVTCSGGLMNMVSRGGGSMSMGRGTTTGSLLTGGSMTNSSVTLINSPVNGSSITITDTLGRVWGLLSHP